MAAAKKAKDGVGHFLRHLVLSKESFAGRHMAGARASARKCGSTVLGISRLVENGLRDFVCG